MSVMGSKQYSAAGEIKVTLFPFLAVLLCTMGALIMLLVVITRNVQEQAVMPMVVELEQNDTEQLTTEQATEILEQIKMGAEEADWFAENLAKSKVEAAEKLAEKKTQLALAEKQTQKIRDEIERLSKLAEQLSRNEKTSTSEVTRLQKILEQRQRREKAEELELAELQKDAEKNAKSYSVIPYKGTGGTFRRPIYIECLDNKIIIQPEGIELTEADFILGNRANNPLEMILQTIRLYYLETGQIVRGTEPYPLLIVRPSGVEAYETTRQSVGTWIKEFGYELVEEDWKIEYPAPSAELKERIEKALALSRNRTAGYLEAMRGTGYANPLRRTEQYRLDHRGNVQPAKDDIAIPMNRNNATAENGSTRRSTNSPNTSPSQPSQSRSQAPSQSQSPNSPIPSFDSPNSYSISSVPDPDISLIERTPEKGNDEIVGEPRSATSPPQADLSRLINPAFTFQPYAPSYSSQTQTENQTENSDLQERNAETKNQNVPNSQDSSNASTASALNPTASALNHSNPSKTSSSLASARAKNWALKDAVPFSAAVSRTIKIRCEADKFVLVPQTALIGVRVVPITNSVQESTDKLVAVIWEFMDSWGSAGEKMFWRPILQIHIQPGGEQRFQELKYLLRDSGLVIEETK